MRVTLNRRESRVTQAACQRSICHATPQPSSTNTALLLRRRSPRPQRQFSFSKLQQAEMRGQSPPQYSVVVAPVVLVDTQHSNASAYTLETIPVDNTYAPSLPTSLDDHEPLLGSNSSTSSSYGAVPLSPSASSEASRSSRKVMINAGLKMSALFIISTAILGGTLWLALPTLEA